MGRVYAVRIHRNGGPEELRYEEVEVGEPGPGEARVRHTAIGLNFTDIHHRTGRYPVSQFPHVIGMEATGVVEAVGEGVSEVRPGDRVAYASEKPRAYSQATVMPITRLVKLPDFLDDETAAAVILKGLTAQYLIRGAHPVSAGETILIQAAAGGVGLIMCQWARHLGARVIGTVSTAEKAELAKAHGCEYAIIYTQEDVVARVRSYGWRGVTSCLRRCRRQHVRNLARLFAPPRSVCVSYGTAGGLIPPFDLFRLNRMGSLYLTSAGLADYLHTRNEMLERAADLFAVLKSGAVRISVKQRYPLADAARAHRDLEARRTVGSSVLLP
jgi:NADPH:quinone reductase